MTESNHPLPYNSRRCPSIHPSIPGRRCTEDIGHGGPVHENCNSSWAVDGDVREDWADTLGGQPLPVPEPGIERTNLPPEEISNHLGFHLDNGVIETLFVESIALPSFTFKSKGVVGIRATLLLTMTPCQKAYKQVMLAAREGFEHFKIEFQDGNLDVVNTWEFYGARVAAIDSGILSRDAQAPPPDFKCEISYETLEIDGVKL